MPEGEKQFGSRLVIVDDDADFRETLTLSPITVPFDEVVEIDSAGLTVEAVAELVRAKLQPHTVIFLDGQYRDGEVHELLGSLQGDLEECRAKVMVITAYGELLGFVTRAFPTVQVYAKPVPFRTLINGMESSVPFKKP